MTRDEINAFGEAVKVQMLDGEDAIVIAVGAVAPSPDCRVTTVTATIWGNVGKVDQTFTGNALHLDDAIAIARGKLRDARAAHERTIAKAKSAPTPETIDRGDSNDR